MNYWFYSLHVWTSFSNNDCFNPCTFVVRTGRGWQSKIQLAATTVYRARASASNIFLYILNTHIRLFRFYVYFIDFSCSSTAISTLHSVGAGNSVTTTIRKTHVVQHIHTNYPFALLKMFEIVFFFLWLHEHKNVHIVYRSVYGAARLPHRGKPYWKGLSCSRHQATTAHQELTTTEIDALAKPHIVNSMFEFSACFSFSRSVTTSFPCWKLLYFIDKTVKKTKQHHVSIAGAFGTSFWANAVCRLQIVPTYNCGMQNTVLLVRSGCVLLAHGTLWFCVAFANNHYFI